MPAHLLACLQHPSHPAMCVSVSEPKPALDGLLSQLDLMHLVAYIQRNRARPLPSHLGQTCGGVTPGGEPVIGLELNFWKVQVAGKE